VAGWVRALFVLWLLPTLGHADAPSQPPTGEQASEAAALAPTPSEGAVSRRARLVDILESRELLQLERRKVQAELKSDEGQGREAELTRRIQEISTRLDELGRSFTELATSVDPADLERQEAPIRVELSSEIRELLGPLLNELKRATSRPREIDRLRTEVAGSEDRLALIQRAVSHLERLQAGTEDEALRAQLEAELAEWVTRRQELRTRLSVAKGKLEQKLSERTTVSEAIQNVLQLFLKSRGRNLLIAFLAALGFLFLFHRLHQTAVRAGPLQQRANSLSVRVLDLLFLAFTAIGGVLVFVVVLYFFGDWVLLILVLLLILGIIWTSKQAIPRFWTQATLVLNMGPVREAERVVYRGIPFQVQSLNFYSQLRNPELAGGLIRLPVRDLTELRSRAFDEGELWFPTRPGDWVVLADETYGQVVFQSMDEVRLRLKGDSVKVYRTVGFLEANPTNLSKGFRVRTTFGVDYRHQWIALSEVVPGLEAAVRAGLEATQFAPHLRSLRAGFAEAGSSSLDVRIVADFSGDAANAYPVLPRIMQHCCVEACNRNGWVIPFTQLTLHAADGTRQADEASRAPLPEGTRAEDPSPVDQR
jgi:hypothetical protein